jgi:hypothetical protein
MKHTLILIGFLMLTSCARKVTVKTPSSEYVVGERYSYVKDEAGRVWVVTSNSKDFNEAMKKIQPGPSSVDKLDLWVITPLQPDSQSR